MADERLLPGVPLEPGERVLLDRRADPLDGPLSSLGFVAITLVLAGLVRAMAAQATLWLSPGDVVIAGAMLIGVRLVWAEVVRRVRRYVLTDRRVLARYGVLRRTVVAVPLDRIQHTVVTRRVRERFAGLGSVGFATAGTGSFDVVWAGVRSPDEAHAAALDAVRAASRGEGG